MQCQFIFERMFALQAARRPQLWERGRLLDMESGSTTCEGDVKFCEKPDALKQYLQRKRNDFEKKENKDE